ncbi:MAG: cobyrinate a,c-diamide synthase [Lachnospiraceae bacterium]|nr:cobyrinate a,c-diamide synthase [Lachnospiraceae bacterium]
MNIKRVMIAAPKSGSGKTGITCALLKSLKNKGIKTVSFKCGPDYIDPMYHKNALGIPSYNLDTFFTGELITRSLFARNASGFDFAVFEGVMGLFDGVGGVREEGSSYNLAEVTGTPIILVIDAKGMGRSVIPEILGFKAYDKNDLIKGVILNRTSESMFNILKPMIEGECGISALGFIPDMKERAFSSRHLGLVTPGDSDNYDEVLEEVTGYFEKNVSFDELEKIALSAEDIKDCDSDKSEPSAEKNDRFMPESKNAYSPVIAVAKDEAFCFFYEDNLTELKNAGAKLVFFSPIHDERIPENADGLMLPGGYPELHLKELSENTSMLESVRSAFERKMPVFAECGGFMYLQKSIEDKDGKVYITSGIFDGELKFKGKPVRFGYVSMKEKSPDFLNEGGEIRGHEFHYFDCDDNGSDVICTKPFTGREYEAVKTADNLWAGFPHLYFPSNPSFAVNFVKKCRDFAKK